MGILTVIKIIFELIVICACAVLTIKVMMEFIQAARFKRKRTNHREEG